MYKNILWEYLSKYKQASWNQFFKYTQVFKVKKLSVFACFVLMFVYGFLLLMIGYTNPYLQDLTGLGKINPIVLAIPQSIGLIASTFFLKKLLARYNIRIILSVSYFIAIICVALLSQLDHISDNKAHLALGLYVFISLVMGASIGLTSPIVSTYFSAIYTSKRRSTMLSIVNGVYGIGAGLLPLAIAGPLYELGNAAESPTSSFSSVRFFYYIAILFAIIGFLASLCLDYNHKTFTLTTKGMKSKKIKSTYLVAVSIIILLFVSYMFSETICNYAFANFVRNSSSPTKNVAITATQSFGLFLMLQGLWRCISGLTLSKWIKFRTFITMSSVFIFIGFVILATGVVGKDPNLAFLVSVLFAIGIGNVWPILFAYGSGMNNEKAALTGVAMNLTSMIMILIVQGYSTGLLSTLSSNNWYNQAGYIWLAITGAFFTIFIIVLIWFLSIYLRRSGNQHPDERKKAIVEKVAHEIIDINQ